MPQHRLRLPQADQPLDLRAQRQVRLPAFVGPGVGRAVVRVLAAAKADLVAVIDRGRARVAHLEEHRQQQAPLAVGDLLRRAVVAHAEVMQRARLVVRGQQRHGREQRLRRIGLAQQLQVLVGALRADAGREVQHGIAEDVVHRRVEGVAEEELAGVEPGLRDRQRLRLVTLDRDAPGAPEIVRHPGRDVHAPARRAAVQPELHHAVPAEGVVAEGAAGLVQLGQVLDADPGGVLVVGPGPGEVEAEPARIGRGRVGLAVVEGAAGREVAEAVEVGRVRADVVQRGVRDHAQAALAGLAGQALEVVVAAEGRIDALVVAGVVLVIAGGLEDRRQVQRVDAQLAQVIELVDEAGEVAAEEVVVVDRVRAVAAARLVRAVQPARMALDAVVLVPGLADLRIVGAVAVAEALGEDVVVDEVAREAGDGEVGGVDGLAIAADRERPLGIGALGQRRDAGRPHRALLLGPVDRVGVVLDDVAGTVDRGDEVVAVDTRRAEAVTGLPALAALGGGGLVQRHAGLLGIGDQVLVALDAAALDDQFQLLDAGQRGQLELDPGLRRLRAEGRLEGGEARVVAQACRDGAQRCGGGARCARRRHRGRWWAGLVGPRGQRRPGGVQRGRQAGQQRGGEGR